MSGSLCQKTFFEPLHRSQSHGHHYFTVPYRCRSYNFTHLAPNSGIRCSSHHQRTTVLPAPGPLPALYRRSPSDQRIRSPRTYSFIPCNVQSTLASSLSSTSSFPSTSLCTSGLFAACTLLAIGLGALMIFLPRWRITRQLVASPWCISPIAVAYGILLVWSWQPDTFSLILPGSWEAGFQGGFNPQFFPSLSGIVTLFSRVATAASLWVHIVAVNLFAARQVFLEGLDLGVPTRHSVALCLTFAPMGLLAHGVTKRCFRV